MGRRRFIRQKIGVSATQEKLQLLLRHLSGRCRCINLHHYLSTSSSTSTTSSTRHLDVREDLHRSLRSCCYHYNRYCYESMTKDAMCDVMWCGVCVVCVVC